MSNAANRDAPPGNCVRNHVSRKLGRRIAIGTNAVIGAPAAPRDSSAIRQPPAGRLGHTNGDLELDRASPFPGGLLHVLRGSDWASQDDFRAVVEDDPPGLGGTFQVLASPGGMSPEHEAIAG
jgi:hypothetical protein